MLNKTDGAHATVDDIDHNHSRGNQSFGFVRVTAQRQKGIGQNHSSAILKPKCFCGRKKDQSSPRWSIHQRRNHASLQVDEHVLRSLPGILISHRVGIVRTQTQHVPFGIGFILPPRDWNFGDRSDRGEPTSIWRQRQGWNEQPQPLVVPVEGNRNLLSTPEDMEFAWIGLQFFLVDVLDGLRLRKKQGIDILPGHIHNTII